ncbi:glycosyl transferase family 4 domain-containing protein [Ditylenchus destructor]|nr:glycosyl transferase family 4 domain-containing protein [Ditylenchus destructor]
MDSADEDGFAPATSAAFYVMPVAPKPPRFERPVVTLPPHVVFVNPVRGGGGDHALRGAFVDGAWAPVRRPRPLRPSEIPRPPGAAHRRGGHLRGSDRHGRDRLVPRPPPSQDRLPAAALRRARLRRRPDRGLHQARLPGQALLATAVSAALGCWVLGAMITRTDIPGLDLIVGTTVGAVLATVLTVAGVANSVNIIDGFNGLSSMCVSLMLLTFAYVAYQVGDTEIALWSLAGVGAILGFFVWNFPGGLIFLGDGGAYFMGFYLAEIGILIIHRHPEVSPLFALMVCIYPVFETLFSIYRRRFLRNTNPGDPDGIHLHSLIYRRLMRWAIGARDARLMTRRNSMTARISGRCASPRSRRRCCSGTRRP